MAYWTNTELIPFLIKFSIAFIVLLYGSITDLKTREVPDWINYGLIISGVALNGIFSAILSDWSYIIQSAIGLAIFFCIGWLMFYAGQWGGGDSKMLMGLGAMIGLNIKFDEPQFLAGFLINAMLVGAIYGLLWSMIIAAKNWKKFRINLSKVSKEKKIVVVKKIILTIVIIAAFSVLFVNDYMTKTALLGMALIIAISFYLWISIRAVEKISMLKYVEPMKLTEGDWIVKDIVYNGKKIVGPKDLGIEKNQIKILIGLYKKGKIRKVLIKEGIPFVPSFFLAFIVTLIFGNLIWMII